MSWKYSVDADDFEQLNKRMHRTICSVRDSIVEQCFSSIKTNSRWYFENGDEKLLCDPNKFKEIMLNFIGGLCAFLGSLSDVRLGERFVLMA